MVGSAGASASGSVPISLTLSNAPLAGSVKLTLSNNADPHSPHVITLDDTQLPVGVTKTITFNGAARFSSNGAVLSVSSAPNDLPVDQLTCPRPAAVIQTLTCLLLLR